jgi:hypothetical protein
MANWTGEIVFKSEWKAHAEANAPTKIIYDWQSHETQTWTLKGLSPNKLDEYDVAWKIDGWGDQSEDHPNHNQKWTKAWTIKGDDKKFFNDGQTNIRIRELAGLTWRVQQMNNGQNAEDVIDRTETYWDPVNGPSTTKIKLNHYEKNIPPIEAEKTIQITGRGIPGSEIELRPAVFFRWRWLPEWTRNWVTGWIINERPVASNDIDSYGHLDPRKAMYSSFPVYTLTGYCSWSWQLHDG